MSNKEAIDDKAAAVEATAENPTTVEDTNVRPCPSEIPPSSTTTTDKPSQVTIKFTADFSSNKESPKGEEKSATKDDTKETSKEENSNSSTKPEKSEPISGSNALPSSTQKPASAENEEKRTKKDGTNQEGGGSLSETSSNDKKRPAERATPPGFPAQPIKAARTAYFIFAADKREEIKKSHPGESVGFIARITGQLWNALTDEEKSVYQGKAAEERERVAQEIAKYNLDAINLGTGSGALNNTRDPLALEIPQARLKKIVRLDPEVKGVSREAMLLLGKAAELFTAKLGVESVKVASLQNRRKLLPDDVAQICQTREKFLFLKDDVKDLLKEQHLEKKAAAANKAAAASESTASAASNSKPLTAYFTAAKS